MATSKSTGTRSTAKRSTAKRTSGTRRPPAASSKATPATAPEKSGVAAKPKSDAKVENKAETTAELTQEEVIANAIKEDHVRIKDEDGNFIEGVTQMAARVKSLVDLALPFADKVQVTYQAFSKANGILAGYMLEIRESIILADNMPDWFGTSKTYKDAVTPIIDRAWQKDSGETRTTVVNRLQKRQQRMAAERIALYANADAGLELPEDEVLRILHLGDEATQGENAKDENVQNLVKAVNRQYRTGVKVSDDEKGNRSPSPFLPKEKNDGKTTPKSQKPAAEALNNAKAFRGSLEHLTQPLVGEELLHLVLDIRTKALSNEPAFGTPGRQGAVGWMTHVANVLYVTARELDGKEMSKDDRLLIEAAEKVAN